jgi:hypothetical protein
MFHQSPSYSQKIRVQIRHGVSFADPFSALRLHFSSNSFEAGSGSFFNLSQCHKFCKFNDGVALRAIADLYIAKPSHDVPLDGFCKRVFP